MSWYVTFLATDQAPIFKNTDKPMAGSHGPFDEFEEAYLEAERLLKDDINAMRRSLSALQRGEFHADHGTPQ